MTGRNPADPTSMAAASPRRRDLHGFNATELRAYYQGEDGCDCGAAARLDGSWCDRL